MGSQRILGTVLLVVGVILLFIGMNASHSVSDQVSQNFTGRFTQATTWYIIGGIASALLGLLLVLFGVRRRHV
jgi:LPXTG-motif cell wall-anchored protein